MLSFKEMCFQNIGQCTEIAFFIPSYRKPYEINFRHQTISEKYLFYVHYKGQKILSLHRQKFLYLQRSDVTHRRLNQEYEHALEVVFLQLLIIVFKGFENVTDGYSSGSECVRGYVLVSNLFLFLYLPNSAFVCILTYCVKFWKLISVISVYVWVWFAYKHTSLQAFWPEKILTGLENCPYMKFSAWSRWVDMRFFVYCFFRLSISWK